MGPDPSIRAHQFDVRQASDQSGGRTGFNRRRFQITRTGDLNASWFQRLWRFTLQIDMQHSMFVRGPHDLDMIGKRETALKGAHRDPLVKIGFVSRLVSATGGHIKAAFAHRGGRRNSDHDLR
jgi:hypothetical protein